MESFINDTINNAQAVIADATKNMMNVITEDTSEQQSTQPETNVSVNNGIKEVKKQKSKIYIKSMLNKQVCVPFQYVDNTIKQILENEIKRLYTGKCISEGFIDPKSIRIKEYSSGVLKDDNVLFDTVFECLICNPPTGMKLNFVVTNITKAGVRGRIYDKNDPLDIFIVRDHFYNNKEFTKIKVDDEVKISVIGTRYELNDKKITVLGEFIAITKRAQLVIKQ